MTRRYRTRVARKHWVTIESIYSSSTPYFVPRFDLMHDVLRMFDYDPRIDARPQILPG